MFTTRILRTLTGLALVFSLAACSDQGATDSADPSPEAMQDQTGYNLTLSMTEFMAHVLEPAADTLWRSAGWVLDEKEGYYELYPTDDEGWQQAENQAAMIVETGNAMMVPGRAYDNGSWITYSQAMSTVGLSLMKAAEEKNKEDLFQGGAQLYSVCTACHQAYNPDILTRFSPASLTD